MRLCILGFLFTRAFAGSESPAVQEFLRVVQVGRDLHANGRAREASEQFAEALQMAQRLGPAREAMVSAWLGSALIELGRVSEAERVLRRSLTLLEQLQDQGIYDAEAHAKLLTSLAAID